MTGLNRIAMAIRPGALAFGLALISSAVLVACGDDDTTINPTDGGTTECVFDTDAPRCSETGNVADLCSPYVDNCTRFNNCRVPGYPDAVPVVP
jgi:hypothetical protein